MNYILGGDDAMELLGEKLGMALGWAPTLVILPGGEYGPITGKGCETGAFLYSCVVWSVSSQQQESTHVHGSLLLHTRGGQLETQ